MILIVVGIVLKGGSFVGGDECNGIRGNVTARGFQVPPREWFCFLFAFFFLMAMEGGCEEASQNIGCVG